MAALGAALSAGCSLLFDGDELRGEPARIDGAVGDPDAPTGDPIDAAPAIDAPVVIDALAECDCGPPPGEIDAGPPDASPVPDGTPSDAGPPDAAPPPPDILAANPA